MRQQRSLSRYQPAHRFQILQCRLVPEMRQSFSHLGKRQLGLVAKTEEGFGAAQLLARPRDREDLLRRHGVRAHLAGIAAKNAVSAVIATQVGKGNKNFARISDDAWLI